MSKYVPLKVEEQEVLNKLVDRDQELYVEVEDWGFHPSPEIIHGDRRIQIKFPLQFTRPVGLSMFVTEFHLKLKTRSGGVLYEETMDVDPPGQDYVEVQAGVVLDLVWDLWVEKIDDDLVNKISSTMKGKELLSVDHVSGDVTKSEEK